jgi:tetratricopeptide (TPR) repeat protein
VSLGGYWPSHYRYSRYYSYGYHPYYWYGYYPVAREVVSDNYNYYTYNYYGDDYGLSDYAYDTSGYPVVDHTTFADVRERLEQEAEGPDEPTLADEYFEHGVTCFEEGEYISAAEFFAQAMELEPDDMILPFAYCQALFAAGEYSQAAEALREVLAKVTPQEEGIFYPRGLYADEQVLFDQIAELAEKADIYSFDGDLQLLLGYNLLGIGQLDEAVEPLRLAGMDLNNAPSATVLLSMVEKMRIANETIDE